MTIRIIRNRARCKSCGEIIESKHRHDYVKCSCGKIFVDGGTAYIRRGGDPDYLVEMSEYEQTVSEVKKDE